jgi:2-methylisocitrate lyase-like PEP mutase family enzyme
MSSRAEKAQRFLAAHHTEGVLLLPNAWDAGSAKVLASLGFEAIATTSSGHAATLGRLDGDVSRAEALEHAAALSAAVDVPVSADLESGFGADPEAVAATVRDAIAAGLAGGSVEDASGDPADPILPLEVAVARVAAAAAAAEDWVLTARAESHLHGRDDLADTIARLNAYAEAGADVLYAPGLTRAEDIRAVVEAVPLPLNVLALSGTPSVPELAELGVRRVSVGGHFAFAALDALMTAATELREAGTYGFTAPSRAGARALRAAVARGDGGGSSDSD